MKSLKLIIASVLAFAAIGASAQPTSPSKFSGDIGYTSVAIEGGGYSTAPSIVRASLAYDINPNLAIEGMVGISAVASDFRVGGTTYTAKVDNLFGVYLKPKAQVNQDFGVYARLGYIQATTTAAVNGYYGQEKNNSVSYGIGATYQVAPTVALNLDYASYYNKNGVSANGLTAGVAFRF